MDHGHKTWRVKTKHKSQKAGEAEVMTTEEVLLKKMSK